MASDPHFQTDDDQCDRGIDVLAGAVRALDALGELIVSEDRLLFFEQHHPLLLKMRPIDLLDTEDGAVAVMRLIEGLESGAFA